MALALGLGRRVLGVRVDCLGREGRQVWSDAV